GRDAESAIRYAYAGWFGEWERRVGEVVAQHRTHGRSFAQFYHSILALDGVGNVAIRQVEGTLPDLAEALARDGFVGAGVLDSGGSCAIYDVWMASYLNHGWYFRE